MSLSRGSVLAAGAALALASAAAAAGELRSGMQVELVDAEGAATPIATIDFERSGDAWSYRLDFAQAPFTDHFLSMRPFRCLEQGPAMLCLLPYPYEKGSTVAGDDFRNLEYDLLFLEKTAAEYGIDAWNGRYYRLREAAVGFEGVLHEVDLNVLAAPPEDGVDYPVTGDMLHEADPSAHLFPRLRIR